MHGEEATHQHLVVLVIEDNPMFRDLALRMMPDCQNHSAPNAKQGLELFCSLKPHITFLDIGLPDGNGLELLKEMRLAQPQAYIVMLTQSRISTDVETAIRNGAGGYVCKPFSRKEIQGYFTRYAATTLIADHPPITHKGQGSQA